MEIENDESEYLRNAKEILGEKKEALFDRYKALSARVRNDRLRLRRIEFLIYLMMGLAIFIIKWLPEIGKFI